MATQAEIAEMIAEVAKYEMRLGRLAPDDVEGAEAARLEWEEKFDGELLMERADAGWKMLRDTKVGGIDPYDVLVAVVWPSPRAVLAQIERRLEALLESAA